ncbi:hypothetical protein [Bacillus safensis]|nr:hypothetical protein [Bacillus safensis]
MKKEICEADETKKVSYEKNEPIMNNLDAFFLDLTWIIPIFLLIIYFLN